MEKSDTNRVRSESLIPEINPGHRPPLIAEAAEILHRFDLASTYRGLALAYIDYLQSRQWLQQSRRPSAPAAGLLADFIDFKAGPSVNRSLALAGPDSAFGDWDQVLAAANSADQSRLESIASDCQDSFSQIILLVRSDLQPAVLSTLAATSRHLEVGYGLALHPRADSDLISRLAGNSYFRHQAREIGRLRSESQALVADRLPFLDQASLVFGRRLEQLSLEDCLA